VMIGQCSVSCYALAASVFAVVAAVVVWSSSPPSEPDTKDFERHLPADPEKQVSAVSAALDPANRNVAQRRQALAFLRRMAPPSPLFVIAVLDTFPADSLSVLIQTNPTELCAVIDSMPASVPAKYRSLANRYVELHPSNKHRGWFSVALSSTALSAAIGVVYGTVRAALKSGRGLNRANLTDSRYIAHGVNAMTGAAVMALAVSTAPTPTAALFLSPVFFLIGRAVNRYTRYWAVPAIVGLTAVRLPAGDSYHTPAPVHMPKDKKKAH